MSKPRVDMHRLQDLVRLHRKGIAPTEVARVLGMSRKTERAYRRALRKAKLLDGAPEAVPPLEVLRLRGPWDRFQRGPWDRFHGQVSPHGERGTL